MGETGKMVEMRKRVGRKMVVQRKNKKGMK
jgi:hypothetical protein